MRLSEGVHSFAHTQTPVLFSRGGAHRADSVRYRLPVPDRSGPFCAKNLLALLEPSVSGPANTLRLGNPSRVPAGQPPAPSPAQHRPRRGAPPSTLPTLEALPTPETVRPETNWVSDEHAIVRVNDPDFAHMAALLTVANLWKRPFDDIALFRQHPKSTILGLNLLQIFRSPGVDLCSFDRSDGLREMLDLNLPLVLDVQDVSRRLSPTVVLTGLEGELATLSDPILGQVQLGLPSLEPLVRKVTVVYLDAHDLALLAPGQENEGVPILRDFLASQGFLDNPSRNNPLFTPDLAEALSNYQKSIAAPQTGALNGPLAARIASAQAPFAPRILRQAATSLPPSPERKPDV